MIHKVTFLTTQSKTDHFCTGLTAACLQDLIPRGKEKGKLMGFFCLLPAICLELEKNVTCKRVRFTDNAAEKNATCSISMDTEK